MPHPRDFTAVAISFAFLAAVISGLAYAQQQHKYMGVGSCSSSNCHGSVSPRNSTNVLQNEFTTWSKHDAHSRAWITLTNAESKKIAEHLGIKSAEQEPLCLDCHATFVPAREQQGERYRLEDGVGCESCHGPAEKYLATHAEDGATRESNLENGIQDIVSPSKRAELCLSCHYGTEQKYVDHRLIGAGHPRLTFELDTFSALEPVHWLVDDDYSKRKEPYSPLRAWLVGQARRAAQSLEILSSDTRATFGDGFMRWPELTLMYCYTCHHSLAEQQWQSRTYGGKPGELRLNIASLLVTHTALKALRAEKASGLESGMEALHASGDIRTAIRQLSTAIAEAEEFFSRYSGNDKDASFKLLRALLQFGSEAQSPPYEVAEQIAMGVSSITAQLSPSAPLYKQQVDTLYSSLSEPHTFDPRGFTHACTEFLANL